MDLYIVTFSASMALPVSMRKFTLMWHTWADMKNAAGASSAVTRFVGAVLIILLGSMGLCIAPMVGFCCLKGV